MSIIGLIYTLIQAFLSAVGLWNQFLDYSDAKRKAEAEAKTQALNKAVDESKGATTDEEIEKSQDDIVRNMP